MRPTAIIVGRIAAATGATAAGVVMLLSLKPHDSADPALAAPDPGPSGIASAANAQNGTFQGRVVKTRYGPVQVEATVSNGKLTDVRALRMPNEDEKDREIAREAEPKLEKRALAAGDARIDAVSGATYTSKGYVLSLQSALDRAGG